MGPNGPVSALPRHAGRTGYGAAALERELGRLALSQPGGRNHALNASAFNLGQLVAGKALATPEVVHSLFRVARQIGLSDPEIEATVASGLRAGMHTPRGASR